MSLLQSVSECASCLNPTTAAALVIVGLLFLYRWLGNARNKNGAEVSVCLCVCVYCVCVCGGGGGGAPVRVCHCVRGCTSNSTTNQELISLLHSVFRIHVLTIGLACTPRQILRAAFFFVRVAVCLFACRLNVWRV